MASRTKTSFSLGAGLILTLSAVGIGAFLGSDPVSADPPAMQTPDQIKADMLLNIARYVEWPSGVFVQSNSPVMLGVYGKTRLMDELKIQGKEKRVNGREILVRQFFWPAPPNCNVLYISETEKPRVAWILRKVQYSSVLTVSELEDFTSHGGMVRFVLQDQKVRFHINMAAATNAQLKVSSRLLNVADSVKWGPEK